MLDIAPPLSASVTDSDRSAERDRLFRDLEQTKNLSEVYDVPNFHKVCEGRNGGGDKWHTDGKLYVGVIDPNFN